MMKIFVFSDKFADFGQPCALGFEKRGLKSFEVKGGYLAGS